jgi:hypothetical protein
MPVVVILISRLAKRRPLQTWQLKKVRVGRMKTCTLGSLSSVGWQPGRGFLLLDLRCARDALLSAGLGKRLTDATTVFGVRRRQGTCCLNIAK